MTAFFAAVWAAVSSPTGRTVTAVLVLCAVGVWLVLVVGRDGPRAGRRWDW